MISGCIIFVWLKTVFPVSGMVFVWWALLCWLDERMNEWRHSSLISSISFPYLTTPFIFNKEPERPNLLLTNTCQILGNGVPLGTLRDKVRLIYSLEEGPGLDVEYGGGLVLMTEVGGLCLAGRTVCGAYSSPSTPLLQLSCHCWPFPGPEAVVSVFQ